MLVSLISLLLNIVCASELRVPDSPVNLVVTDEMDERIGFFGHAILNISWERPRSMVMICNAISVAVADTCILFFSITQTINIWTTILWWCPLKIHLCVAMGRGVRHSNLYVPIDVCLHDNNLISRSIHIVILHYGFQCVFKFLCVCKEFVE